MHIQQMYLTRRVDHHVTGNGAGVGLRRLDQNTDHVVENVHHLRPGDGIRRPEAAVGTVGDEAPAGHLTYRLLCVGGYLPHVGIGQNGVLAGGDAEGPGDHGDRLLAGDGGAGIGLAVVA